jgi:type IV pilus assembly protein PilM
MELLPKALGTRPRLAVEIRAEGVVAARAEDAAGLLVAVSRVDAGDAGLTPGLKAGNITDRAAMTRAIRTALDAAARGVDRIRDVTVVVPDAAVRVLLLDFDSLPSKVAEALPVVRFRLKKLLPFDVEDAVVSYQVMSSAKGLVTVLAVAIPREVLAEYEGLVTAAGYVPGAVLPSTLAALAGLGTATSGAEESVASAVLVVNAGSQQVTTSIVKGGVLLLHRTLEMNVMFEETPHEAYDRIDAEAAMQAQVVSNEVTGEDVRLHEGSLQTVNLSVGSSAWEVAQAVSVAAAYFEDTLGSAPEMLFAAGTTSADSLERMLRVNGLDGLRVREMMEPGMLAISSATVSVPRGWLAGVKGALTS